MEPFQIHAVVQTTALLFFLLGIYYARRHKRRWHHFFVYSAVGLLTIGVAYMLYIVGGVPSIHGKFGLFVYLYVLFAAMSGRLFWGRKIKRNTHKLIALSAVLLLSLQILLALYLYVL
ncbi:hypothetical protein [Thermococcus alcaliphilus]|uniref:hypothetical protein n=1 Tax=Thermococcus alcaliphilus TaxID=139207 RepID=UPI002090FD12|nr:hypothetical protein [Thermococcus alcaliphilus]